LTAGARAANLGRGNVRDRMLQSLVESERTLGEGRMILGLLRQNCAAEDLPALEGAMPPFVRPLATAQPGRGKG